MHELEYPNDFLIFWSNQKLNTVYLITEESFNYLESIRKKYLFLNMFNSESDYNTPLIPDCYTIIGKTGYRIKDRIFYSIIPNKININELI